MMGLFAEVVLQPALPQPKLDLYKSQVGGRWNLQFFTFVSLMSVPVRHPQPAQRPKWRVSGRYSTPHVRA